MDAKVNLIVLIVRFNLENYKGAVQNKFISTDVN